MNVAAQAGSHGSRPVTASANNRGAYIGTLIALAIVFALFFGPMLNLWRFVLSSELYSHIPLVPLMVAYLIWGRRAELARAQPSPCRLGAAIAFILGLGVLLVSQFGSGAALIVQDKLCVQTLSLLSCGLGCVLYFLGWAQVRRVAFPLALLLLMAPLPLGWERAVEHFLQERSADAAWALFGAAGAPVVRNGLVFDLPDLPIQVARECSGIRSSLVLVITSLLAAYLFLESSVRRAVLVLFTIPLGILRNGFRIFVIGELCIYRGPQMLDSWVHRKGGPLFFVLSLGVLWAFLVLLRSGEMRRRALVARPVSSPPAAKDESATE